VLCRWVEDVTRRAIRCSYREGASPADTQGDTRMAPHSLLSAVRRLRRPRTASIEVDAPPAAVMTLVEDPVAMARLGEEIHRVRLLDGATAATVGTRFAGSNRHRLRRWTTICTVTDATETRYGFEVHAPRPLGVHISRWQYDVEPLDEGQRTRLTQTNWIKVPLWFLPAAVTITGTANRAKANQQHIETTLERVKTAMELA
jgi:Polyketide cyclase / dehydrase and lipid transport